MPRRYLLSTLALAALLAGCDKLGIESASAVAERKLADGKAIGAACRHAGRAIEDCYTLNAKAEKASVYAGWREMDDYMRENKLEPVAPKLGADAESHTADKEEEAEEPDDAASKPGKKVAHADTKPAKAKSSH